MDKNLRRLATICMVIVIGITLLACTDKNKKNKDGAKEEAKDQTPKIGDEVSFKDSKWVVLKAEDKGTTLRSNNQFQGDAQTTGKFILVHFKVTNLDKKEQRIINTPKLIDSTGREFKDYDNQAFFIPDGAKTMAVEALPSSLTKEFYAVYEVPADAKGLRFQTRDLTSVFSPDYKLIDLGF